MVELLRLMAGAVFRAAQEALLVLVYLVNLLLTVALVLLAVQLVEVKLNGLSYYCCRCNYRTNSGNVQ